MDFNEIQMFPRAHYEIDVEWRHMETILQRFVDDYGLVLLPDFQRGHVWTTKQQTSYVEYMLRGGESGNTILFNHPQWDTCIKKESEFVILDGLQRLTAVRKFMASEIPAFGHLYREFTGSLRMHARFKFRVLSLPDRATVLSYYLAFNDGGTIHPKSELDRVRALLKAEG